MFGKSNSFNFKSNTNPYIKISKDLKKQVSQINKTGIDSRLRILENPKKIQSQFEEHQKQQISVHAPKFIQTIKKYTQAANETNFQSDKRSEAIPATVSKTHLKLPGDYETQLQLTNHIFTIYNFEKSQLNIYSQQNSPDTLALFYQKLSNLAELTKKVHSLILTKAARTVLAELGQKINNELIIVRELLDSDLKLNSAFPPNLITNLSIKEIIAKQIDLSARTLKHLGAD